LLEKVPHLLKPFLPQLQRTFVKSLSEGNTPEMRSKTANCLSLLIPLQPRLDPLVMELVQGIKLSDSDVKKSMWEAMFGLLQGVAQGKLNEGSINAIQGVLLEFLDEKEAPSAAPSFGVFASIVPDMQNHLLELLCGRELDPSMLAYLESWARYTKSFPAKLIETVVDALRSPNHFVVEAALSVVFAMLESGSYVIEFVPHLIHVLQTTESSDAKRVAIGIFKKWAKDHHQVFLP
jgi:hypothetical protein